MTTARRFVLGLLLLAAAGCSAQSAGTTGGPAAAEQSTVLLLGDSIAVGQALPLAAAFEAGGVRFESLAAEGGGNVVGPGSESRWQDLSREIRSAEPTVVVYQITTYDWGSRSEQLAAYEKLRDTVTDAGAKLVFVTMPPIEPDDFYRPHMAELGRTTEVARAVASSGQVVVLDAGEVWGSRYRQIRDGKADRSADGIHTCPQGAARFTSWLLGELVGVLPGFVPPAAEAWANTGWSADEHFKGC